MAFRPAHYPKRKPGRFDKAQPAPRILPPSRSVHAFVAGGGTDWRDVELCAELGCGQPAEHPRHQLPDTDPAAVEQEQRRYPDREDT